MKSNGEPEDDEVLKGQGSSFGSSNCPTIVGRRAYQSRRQGAQSWGSPARCCSLRRSGANEPNHHERGLPLLADPTTSTTFAISSVHRDFIDDMLD